MIKQNTSSKGGYSIIRCFNLNLYKHLWVKGVRQIFLAALIIIAISCRFTKPFIGIPDGHEKGIWDSLTMSTYKSHSLLYPCLRTDIGLGRWSVTGIYDIKHRLKQKMLYKRTDAFMCDGNVRYFDKTIYYDTLGRKDSIHYSIFQNQGVGGYRVMDKTVIVKH